MATGDAIDDPAIRNAIEALAVALRELADMAGHALAADLAQGRIQQRSIVSLVAPDVPGYDLASHYAAAREIGGDFFELFRLRRRSRPLSIVIADVTGKGIAAALLMAFARPVIHGALNGANGPAQALERTNKILVDERRSILFITVLVGELDLPSGRIRLANAGHEPPLVVPADGSPIRQLEIGGVLMGAFPTLGLREVDLTLAPGDVLFLYTDGVTDARGPSGERFGEARMVEVVDAARGGTAKDIVDAVRGAVAAFSGDVEPADDVTIVAVGRRRG
ncbi:MAG TPA: PP2C family protein-serine/threonine phosphatase [Candidatus Limnocylindrales bacterium]|nr:PP2C family protein-serine/threonine phosphatase [Candidatus Limnocylindrales bacterium]